MPLIVEFFTADKIKSVLIAGDSRFGIGGSDVSTQQYKSVSNLLQKKLDEMGKPSTVNNAALSGATLAQYNALMTPLLSGSTPHDTLIYLVWTINGATTTSAAAIKPSLAEAKSKAMLVVDAARKRGTKVILVSAFPSQAGFIGGVVIELNKLAVFCKKLGDGSFDPNIYYGDDSYRYQTDYSDGTGNHMLQNGYNDIAVRLANLV
jgi:hypothetical protein